MAGGTSGWGGAFHGVANACHQARSSLTASVSLMVSWRPRTEELVSIILCRKVLPAATTEAVKLRVLLRERSSSFLQRVRVGWRQAQLNSALVTRQTRVDLCCGFKYAWHFYVFLCFNRN